MLELNKVYLGDNIELMKKLDDNSIHSCVSDFPYNLSFMGKKWDTIPNYQEWCYHRAQELLRVLKPGGYCLIFGGTRTHHRLVCAFEDAGFNIRDEIMWLYGSGFPKSYNISKGFDKKAGVEREVIGKSDSKGIHTGQGNYVGDSYKCDGYDITAPSTDLAKQWDGWGTALKPAHEPIMVAQKPIEKNYCYNVEKYGVGGINIDDSRVEYQSEKDINTVKAKCSFTENSKSIGFGTKESLYGVGNTPLEQARSCVKQEGRFPANVVLDETTGMMLDEKSGGASRFFYCPKTSKKDKTENGLVNNIHPTVKPTDLIKYLVRLVTPKNGICLDICEGSGTHVKACISLANENYPVNYIGFENDEESFKIIKERVKILNSES